MCSLFNNLNSILEKAEVEKDQAEVSFDDLGVVAEFNSNAFYRAGSAELLPEAKEVLKKIDKEMATPTYELYFIDVEGNGSEERRVGKVCVITCRSRWAQDH